MSSSPAASITSADAAKVFAALGDARRLALVERLQRAGPLPVTALCDGMDVTRQAVSKHLKLLDEARLVTCSKQGRETHYALDRDRLQEASAFLEAVGAKWDDALDRLQAHLAEPAEEESQSD
ncbi:ArsR family transcriptional regulator [Hoeflea halophila]|uniref:ArsR family transcriptional regulator n=1 Tax=Hoeflea halophila TaxID=714899 RepID=A0A286HLX6_9HYPH|nr:metalloregulator ArsR/SmtB family transcription factor [Hoeflea halophila]SOE08778.1 ArsR family transcriptional regulator [Hoeflea halophila]